MRTRISTIAPTATRLLALTALPCAERIPEPVAVPSVPHISGLSLLNSKTGTSTPSASPILALNA